MTERRSKPPRTDAEMEQMLQARRPVPRATFRGALRRQVIDLHACPQPPRLRLLIATYAGSGGLLLAAVALGIAGLGPFSAG